MTNTRLERGSMPPAVRERVVNVVREQQRTMAWLARLLNKSKSWGSGFARGVGTISHAEMEIIAQATNTSVEFFWTGRDYLGQDRASASVVTPTASRQEDATLSDPFGGLRFLWSTLDSVEQVAALAAMHDLLQARVGFPRPATGDGGMRRRRAANGN